VSLGLRLALDHPTQVLGLDGLDLSRIGTDVQLGADVQSGTSFGLDISLGRDLNFASLGSDQSPILGQTGLALDQLLGVPSSIETVPGVNAAPDLGFQNIAPGLGDFGQTVSTVVGTGLGALMGGAGGSASSGDALGSGVIAVLATPHAQEPVISSGDAATMNVVSDVADFSSLQNNGDVSSGNKISFSDPPAVTVAQVDPLFSGGRYTDYGLAMHAEDHSGSVESLSTLNGHSLDGTAGSLSLVDTPTHPHDSGELAPIDQHDIGASLVHLPMPHDEFTVRAASI
jgi:hypothetical protein